MRRLILLFLLLGMGFPALMGQAPAERPLKILSWNIYMLPRFAKITGKRQRAEEIGRLLRESDCDVLVLQESFLGSARNRIARAFGEDFPHRCGPANLKFSVRTNSGIWILSRLPLECLAEIDYAECAGFDDCMARKGALLVEAVWEGRRVQVLGTHLQSGGPHAVRHSQYREMAALLDAHARPGVPQVVCGDMNTRRRDTPNYNIMLETLAATDGRYEGPRQFTSDGVRNDIKPQGSDSRHVIDYIFLRTQGVEMETERRWLPRLEARWHPRHRSLSDHEPVAIELRW